MLAGGEIIIKNDIYNINFSKIIFGKLGINFVSTPLNKEYISLIFFGELKDGFENGLIEKEFDKNDIIMYYKDCIYNTAQRRLLLKYKKKLDKFFLKNSFLKKNDINVFSKKNVNNKLLLKFKKKYLYFINNGLLYKNIFLNIVNNLNYQTKNLNNYYFNFYSKFFLRERIKVIFGSIKSIKENDNIITIKTLYNMNNYNEIYSFIKTNNTKVIIKRNLDELNFFYNKNYYYYYIVY